MKNKIPLIICSIVTCMLIACSFVIPCFATSVVGSSDNYNTYSLEPLTIKQILVNTQDCNFLIDGGTGTLFNENDYSSTNSTVNVGFVNDIGGQVIYNDLYFAFRNYGDPYFPITTHNYFCNTSWLSPLIIDGTNLVYGYFPNSTYYPNSSKYNDLSWVQWDMPFSNEKAFTFEFDINTINTQLQTLIYPSNEFGFVIKAPSGEAHTELIRSQLVTSYINANGFDVVNENITNENGYGSVTTIKVKFVVDRSTNSIVISLYDLNGALIYELDPVSFTSLGDNNGTLNIRFLCQNGSSTSSPLFGGFYFSNFMLTSRVDDTGVKIENSGSSIIYEVGNSVLTAFDHVTTYSSYGFYGNGFFSNNSFDIYFNDFFVDFYYGNFNQILKQKNIYFYFNDLNISSPVFNAHVYIFKDGENPYPLVLSDKTFPIDDIYTVTNETYPRKVLSVNKILEQFIGFFDDGSTKVFVQNFSISFPADNNIEFIEFHNVTSNDTSFSVIQPASNLINYINDIQGGIPIDPNSFNLGNFLATSVGGFFDFYIMPGVSIGGLVAIFLSMGLIFVFLKYYAG